MAISSWFSHEKGWFSIVMLAYPRVASIAIKHEDLKGTFNDFEPKTTAKKCIMEEGAAAPNLAKQQHTTAIDEDLRLFYVKPLQP